MRSIICILSCFLAAPLWAHEFWLEPLAYEVERKSTIEAQLVNGEDFEGTLLPYFGTRTARYEIHAGGRSAPVEARNGDLPGLQTEPLAEGLNIVAYQSSVNRVGYEELEKFRNFAEHKDFAGWEEEHEARGLPEVDFGEAYTRFAKTLVGVGHSRGRDLQIGLEIEIVALANPYVDDLSSGMPVRVFYQDKPRRDVQVELFEKAPDGSVEVTYHRTNGAGIAVLPVKPGHAYLVDNVVLRAPAPELAEARDVVWESLWASLTFAVPE